MDLFKLIDEATQSVALEFIGIEVDSPQFAHTVIMSITIPAEIYDSLKEDLTPLTDAISRVFPGVGTLDKIVSASALISDEVLIHDEHLHAIFNRGVDSDQESDDLDDSDQDDDLLGYCQVEIITQRAKHPRIPRPHYLEAIRDNINYGVSLERVLLEWNMLTWTEAIDRSNNLASMSNSVLLDLINNYPKARVSKRRVFDILGLRCSPYEYFLWGKFPRKYWRPRPWWLSDYVDEYRFGELADLLNSGVRVEDSFVFYIQAKMTTIAQHINLEKFHILHILEDLVRQKYSHCFQNSE